MHRETSGDAKVFEGRGHEEEVPVLWGDSGSLPALQSACSTMQTAVLSLQTNASSHMEMFQEGTLPSPAYCKELKQHRLGDTSESISSQAIAVANVHLCDVADVVNSLVFFFNSPPPNRRCQSNF